jgi:hypothetical protein
MRKLLGGQLHFEHSNLSGDVLVRMRANAQESRVTVASGVYRGS